MTSEVKHKAREATHEVGPWVEALARLGYAARGIVYGLVGILALQAVWGSGSPNVDMNTAFHKILSQPFGQVLLWIIIVGLIGYALWRLIETFLNVEGRIGTLKRIGYFFSGVAYLFLAYTAYKILKGSNSSSGNPSDFTAPIFKFPGGAVLVGLVGVILIGVGLYAIYVGFTNRIEKRFKFGDMSSEERRFAITLGRIGYAARGVVFGIVGYFLLQSAINYNPSQAKGLGGALSTLSQQPYGIWLLGAVAIGLIAFGVYALALARYRRIPV